ncbi:MAG: tautomerase family protein [Salinarimonas sp.]
MPVIQISTFEMKDEAKARALLEEVTAAMHRVTGVPLDKISCFVIEVSPARWVDAGVVGSAPDFQTRSRRRRYDEEPER